jgi:hypothetical protein
MAKRKKVSVRRRRVIKNKDGAPVLEVSVKPAVSVEPDHWIPWYVRLVNRVIGR